MATKKLKRPGPKVMYPGKVRKPVSLTLTPEHHQKIRRRMQALGITRAELIGLLVEKYADFVTIETPNPAAHKRLRVAIEVLGGTLTHQKRGEVRGGTWVLTLGRDPSQRRLSMPSEQSMRYKLLDDCYELRDGVTVTGTWDDNDPDVINPVGLAELFAKLASSQGTK